MNFKILLKSIKLSFYLVTTLGLISIITFSLCWLGGRIGGIIGLGLSILELLFVFMTCMFYFDFLKESSKSD